MFKRRTSQAQVNSRTASTSTCNVDVEVLQLPHIGGPMPATSSTCTSAVDLEVLSDNRRAPEAGLRLRQTTLDLDGRGQPIVVRDSFKHEDYQKYFELVKREEIKDGNQTSNALILRCITPRPNGETCSSQLTVKKSNYFNLHKHLTSGLHNLTKEDIAGHKSVKHVSVSSFPGFAPKYKSNDSAQRAFDQGLLDMIAVDGLPFSFVESVGFKNLMLDVNPRLHIKTRQAYSTKLKNAVLNDVESSIRKILSKIEPGESHYSCDIWSSRRREGILGILVHYIDEDWTLQSLCVAMKQLTDSHTGVLIQEATKEVLEYFGVSFDQICIVHQRHMSLMKNVGSVTTDNAKNMIKAFNMKILLDDSDFDNESVASESEESDSEENIEIEIDNSRADYDENTAKADSDDGDQVDEYMDFVDDDFVDYEGVQLPHHPCVAHTLQLVINDALNADEAAMELLNYVKSIMKFFKRSTKASDKLRKLTKLDLLLPAKTRWNSMLIMLDRFIDDKFFPAIKQVLENEKKVARGKRSEKIPSAPTSTSRDNAKQLHKLLRPLGDATDKLQSDCPTSNLVLLSLLSASKRLKISADTNQDTAGIKFGALRKSLLRNCTERLNYLFNSDSHIVAAILDPRIKLELFESCKEDTVFTVPTVGIAKSALTHEYTLAKLRRAKSNNGACTNTTYTAYNNTVNTEISISAVTTATSEVHSMFDILQPRARNQQTNDEITTYLSENLLTEKMCPNVLSFWKENESKYPTLSMVARKVLAMPSTSAGVERIFSIAGALARARRAKLLPNTIRNVIMYRQHRKPLLKRRLQRAGLHKKLSVTKRKRKKCD